MLKCSHHSGCNRPAKLITNWFTGSFDLSCGEMSHTAGNRPWHPLDSPEGKRLLAKMTASKLQGKDPLDLEIPF